MDGVSEGVEWLLREIKPHGRYLVVAPTVRLLRLVVVPAIRERLQGQFNFADFCLVVSLSEGNSARIDFAAVTHGDERLRAIAWDAIWVLDGQHRASPEAVESFMARLERLQQLGSSLRITGSLPV